jgi:Xaa-Pro dipeptidase
VSGLTDTHTTRIERVRAALAERGLQALWIDPSVDLFYLTGLEPVSLERLFGLLVPAAGELRVVVPLLLRDECTHLPADLLVWSDEDGPLEAARSATSDLSRLGVQGSLPFWAYRLLRSAGPHLEIDLEPGIVGALRECKDPDEVELIRASGAVTDDVVEWVGSLELEGLTERRLNGRIQARYLELGHRPIPEALVASGANAAMPHYTGGDVPIGLDRPLLMDFGGAVGGYWSDITRIYFPRALEPEIAEAYDIVCRAYDAAVAVIEPGVPSGEVDRAARGVITEAGYGDAFVHRTGHGLGLDIHEPPYIVPGGAGPLEVGHVFSVEPGIYVRGRFGVRFENIIHLGPGGPEPVNHSPRIHRFPA